MLGCHLQVHGDLLRHQHDMAASKYEASEEDEASEEHVDVQLPVRRRSEKLRCDKNRKRGSGSVKRQCSRPGDVFKLFKNHL